MAYTTTTLVIEWLGTNYDSTSDLVTADVTAFIAQADEVVDAHASRNFYKFNAVDSSATDGTDTYVTPNVPALASRHLAVSFCFSQIRAKTGNPAYDAGMDYHRNQAQYYLTLLEDKTFRGDVLKYRDETLTFGTNATSWDLDTYQAKIGAATILDSGDPPHVIAGSVAISANSTTDGTFTAAQAATMRNGYEFCVYWSPKHQSWIFQAETGDIADHITTLKVNYDWTYQRDRAMDPACSGVLLSG